MLFCRQQNGDVDPGSKKTVKVLRVLRVLRPLKAINKAKKLKVLLLQLPVLSWNLKIADLFFLIHHPTFGHFVRMPIGW